MTGGHGRQKIIVAASECVVIIIVHCVTVQ